MVNGEGERIMVTVAQILVIFWVVGIMFLVCLKVTWLFQREGKEGSRKVGSYE